MGGTTKKGERTMLYKLTETLTRNGEVRVSIQSSDTPKDGYMEIPPHLLENAQHKTLAEILQSVDEWNAEQLASEQAQEIIN